MPPVDCPFHTSKNDRLWGMTASWTIVVPFVRLAENSSRLGTEARPLTRAIALDTVAAIAAARLVEQIIVINDEPDATDAFTALSPNVTVVPAEKDTETLDIPAVVHSVTGVADGPVVVVRPILPALDPVAVSSMLDGAESVDFGVLEDFHGRSGTTALIAKHATRLGAFPTTSKIERPAGAQLLGLSATLHKSATSARDIAHLRSEPSLGARTRIAAAALLLELPTKESGRRYGIDPPPQT